MAAAQSSTAARKGQHRTGGSEACPRYVRETTAACLPPAGSTGGGTLHSCGRGAPARPRSASDTGDANARRSSIGAWRTKANGENFRANKAPELDVSGTLPSGRSYADLSSFKEALLVEKRAFAKAFSEKMLGITHQGHVIKQDDYLGNLWQTMFGVMGVPVPEDFQGGEADGLISEVL